MKTVIPVSELEKRMRPRAYSTKGFLGPSEALDVVLQQDELALRDLGISFDQIAGELTRLLGTVLKQREKLSQTNFQEYYEREDHTVYWDQQPAPVFSLENLPTTKIGFIVENKYQMLFWQSKGLQDCPWGCKQSNTWSSFDFLLLNRETGKYISAPGLIAHLIKKHHFFEGRESPYRVDPIKLAQVLDLV